ncbi:hypothetical protein CI238_05155, partial [Colletotrichum incanum]
LLTTSSSFIRYSPRSCPANQHTSKSVSQPTSDSSSHQPSKGPDLPTTVARFSPLLLFSYLTSSFYHTQSPAFSQSHTDTRLCDCCAARASATDTHQPPTTLPTKTIPGDGTRHPDLLEYGPPRILVLPTPSSYREALKEWAAASPAPRAMPRTRTRPTRAPREPSTLPRPPPAPATAPLPRPRRHRPLRAAAAAATPTCPSTNTSTSPCAATSGPPRAAPGPAPPWTASAPTSSTPASPAAPRSGSPCAPPSRSSGTPSARAPRRTALTALRRRRVSSMPRRSRSQPATLRRARTISWATTTPFRSGSLPIQPISSRTTPRSTVRTRRSLPGTLRMISPAGRRPRRSSTRTTTSGEEKRRAKPSSTPATSSRCWLA